MGIVIIFAIVTILAVYGSFTALKNKNFLGLVFGVLTFLVFGWFAFMTLIESGFPAAH